MVNFAGRPIQFVPQESLPDDEPYEFFIGRTGCVPTRDNLHDFFNGLIWLHFPQTKARLNQLQFAQLNATQDVTGRACRVGNSRGPLRDAATIFDENAALMIGQNGDVAKLLSDRMWSTAFIERRGDFGRSCDVVLFGHALLEKLVRPYPSITAHCFSLNATESSIPSIPVNSDGAIMALDQLTASRLSSALATSSFFPVPVLGFPGWCSGQDEAFYANDSVFRGVKSRR